MTIEDSLFMMEDGGIRLPCSPEEERRIVEKLKRKAEANLKEGNIFYLISTRWFAGWRKYVGLRDDDDFIGTGHNHSQNGVLLETSIRPGPIDNSDIVTDAIATEKEEPHLIRGLVENQDYVLVPEEVWETLFAWYRGGPALPRKMISRLFRVNKFIVDVYPTLLNLINSRDGKESILQFSKKDSVCNLYEKTHSVIGVEEDKILREVERDRVPSPSHEFDMDSIGNDVPLVPFEPSISSMPIDGGLNLSNGFLTGDSSLKGGFLSSGNAEMGSVYHITDTEPTVESGGLAGLQNLGNTCFMNSAVQCLVHTLPLVKYFLEDFIDDFNSENPLGMQGELALAFGELLRKLWYSGHSNVAPQSFKSILDRFAPQFNGYAQHDSQELLVFLLDGLREDLNRVKRNPCIDSKDSDGWPDEEVAKECWKNHRARDDSLIVDVCQGLYKSTLICPVCDKISIAFDPFMCLSVPLPSATTRTMTVTVVDGDGRGLPMLYTVTVQKLGSVKDLSDALCFVCRLNDDECLLLAEVYEDTIFRYFEDPATGLFSIKDEDRLVAYRLQKKQVTKTKLEIYHGKNYSDNFIIVEKKPFGCPLVTYLDENHLTAERVHSTICSLLSPFRKKRKATLFEFQSHEDHDFCLNKDSTEKCLDQLIDDVGDTDMLTATLRRSLHLVNKYGLEISIDKSTVLRPGHLIKVFLNWTGKVQELFDSSNLENVPVVKGDVTLKKCKKEPPTLLSCLGSFLKEERLGPEDMWYCPGCKEHRQATKKIDLWSLPDILIFHLKRFSQSRYGKNKLDYYLDFPIHDLDLTKYMKSDEFSSQSYVYELYAIINHYGGLEGGHYTAYAKLINEDKWFHFDDCHVSPVSESDIRTSAAYVLFYQRVVPQTPCPMD